MIINITSPILCPFCGAVNNGHATGTDQPPDPGDLSLCVYCEQIGIYDSDPSGRLVVREPTEAEATDLRDMPEVAEGRARLAEFKRQQALGTDR